MIDTLKLRLEKIPLSSTSFFSSTFLSYLDKNPQLTGFVGPFPSIEAFAEVIEKRDFPMKNRSVLVDALERQYQGLNVPDPVSQNIKNLGKENCFTVTTGHQLNIFTGPLFFIYKIISTIKACQILHEQYPDFEFVPVYWMATEDHDFAEINHFNLFGKKYQWDDDQTGAVGRFSTAGIAAIIDELNDCPDFFRTAYLNSKDLTEATRTIVNHLFGSYGLVSIDGDNRELKKLFTPVVKDDLLNSNAFKLVNAQTEELTTLGYKTLVTPREVNLFYLEGDSRERIVQQGDGYKVLNTNLKFSEEEILTAIEQNPENFSPNVILRTLYQETILPNLAYVGGPGELVYWMQFKSTFEHYGIPFPILFPRNNALLINKAGNRKAEKLGLTVSDLFLDLDALKATFLERNAKTTLDLNAEKEQLRKAFNEISSKVNAIDGSLSGYIKAEESRALKNFDQIERRLKKAEENKQETAIKQLQSLKDKLFPKGSLQERHQNFLNFYINNPKLIEDLMLHLDPFDFNFHVLIENE